jgi:biotin-dependent carboxylase-like uncharacterized protein
MIEVIRCGALTTVQDLGRFGLRHLGVSQCGVMDPLATQQANMLLGNAINAAVLEISVGPLVLHFTQASSLVLSGVDFEASLQTGTPRQELKTPILPGHCVPIPAHATLTLARPAIPGTRCYLAIAGGINVPLVLGSRSTDLKSGFGGLKGRSLEAGDIIPVGPASSPQVNNRYGVRTLAPTHVLRALPGPDYEEFTPDSHAQFWMQPWRISHQSSRMGMRLNGKPLRLREPLELLSAGVLPGDVQVPPDGLPIILANDAQTIGGYPRIASVIQADLWQLAHMPALTSVYFQPVTHTVAQAAFQRQKLYLERLSQSIRNQSKSHPYSKPRH